MNPGDEVRLRHNPASRGVLQRSRQRATGLHWYIGLDGQRARWVPESQLELAPSVPDTPLDLLETGEYGTPADLRRILTHIRVSGHPADMLYSMEATNTDFKAFQFKPVIKVLESPSGRALIADEVGLGKTIEAGLIWTELRSRFDARRLLVICPKALREKWKRELQNKFGVDAQICDASEVLQSLQRTADHAPLRLIASTSSLRPPRDWNDPATSAPAAKLARYLDTAQHHPCFDLLVVDEAHHGRNPETRTHRLIALATEAASHAVFLSATPVHNKQMDLFALLQLLDPDTFTDIRVLSEIQEANAPLILARDTVRDLSTTAQAIAEHLGQDTLHPFISDSEQLRQIRADLRQAGSRTLTVPERGALAHRLERVNLLGHVINRTRKRDVEMNRILRDLRTDPVSMTPHERSYYEFVTDSVRDYAERSEITDGWLLSQPQRQMASCFSASLRRWLDGQEDLDDERPPDLDTGEEGNDGTVGPLIEHIRGSLIARYESRDVPLPELRTRLQETDTKYDLLETILRAYFGDHPGEKVVLFSSFRGTVTYLSSRLRRAGFTSLPLMGGQALSVDETISRFAAMDGPQILLSTEVGSEGVDLQFCRLLINYDMPWNPMRIEQRIGRLDRIGQTAEKIIIWTLLHKETIDLRIQERLYEKLDLFRQSLGDCEQVVAKEVRRLTLELLSGELSVEEQNARIEQTALAIQNIRVQEANLEEEAPGLTAYGDYILQRIETAKDMHRWLGAQDIDTYVTENLKRLYPGTRVHRPHATSKSTEASSEPESRVVELDLSGRARRDLDRFIRRYGLSSDTRLTNAYGRTRCRFSSRPGGVAQRTEEVITQFHPVTKFVAATLDDPDRGQPVSAVVSVQVEPRRLRDQSSQLPNGIYVVTIAATRFEGLRETTHIKYAGKSIELSGDALMPEDAERLVMAALVSGEAWLGARGTVDTAPVHEIAIDLFADLSKDFETIRAQEQASNDDRATWQLTAINRQMGRARATHGERARRLRERATMHRERGEGTLSTRFENLAKGADTQLRTLTERLDTKTKDIQRKREVRANPPEELAIAVIRVGDLRQEMI